MRFVTYVFLVDFEIEVSDVNAWRTIPAMRIFNGQKKVCLVLSPFQKG